MKKGDQVLVRYSGEIDTGEPQRPSSPFADWLDGVRR
jgi:hypothetical protein